MTQIRHALSSEAWNGFKQLIRDHGLAGQRSWCEVGGGANPLFSEQEAQSLDVNYAILDVSAEELAKAPDSVQKIQADAAKSDLQLGKHFDLIFSKMLVEHVRDARTFHQNIFEHLQPGGVAIHFFPTLWALPFVVNWLLPDGLSRQLLSLIAPRNTYQQGKFPAYYQWCRGPTAGQVARFQDLGYEVLEYHAYYGHGAYYRRVPWIRRLHSTLARFLADRTQLAQLSSFAIVILKKPSP